jgi:hypothetical protein
VVRTRTWPLTQSAVEGTRYNPLVDKVAVQEWLARFDAVRVIERDAARQGSPSAQRSLDMSLPLIQAARAALIKSPLLLRRREIEDESVRHAWAQLRERLAR